MEQTAAGRVRFAKRTVDPGVPGCGRGNWRRERARQKDYCRKTGEPACQVLARISGTARTPTVRTLVVWTPSAWMPASCESPL